VSYDFPATAAFVAVTSISGIPSSIDASMPYSLLGSVLPTNASSQGIVWTVTNDGTTGATITGNTLNTTAPGTLTVLATIANGTAVGTPYTAIFTITANAVPGIYWTAASNPFSSAILNITYGNGRFVAVGDYGKMAHSTDGITWTAVFDSTFPSDMYGDIYGIVYGGSAGQEKFVAVGLNGRMAYSTNGITWTAVSNSTFVLDISGIVYGGSAGQEKFVAVGKSGRMAYSTDGITWTAVPNSTFSSEIRNIAYGNGRFVAVGSNGRMAHSTDGINWTAVANSTFVVSTICSIVYGGSAGQEKFVAVGLNGRIAYSP